MNDARATTEIDPPTPLRAERSAAALVAQYIHELSPRHARGYESVEGAEGDAQRRLPPIESGREKLIRGAPSDT